jgi:hypothetical protein
MSLQLFDAGLTELPDRYEWALNKYPITKVFISKTVPSPVDNKSLFTALHVAPTWRGFGYDTSYVYKGKKGKAKYTDYLSRIPKRIVEAQLYSCVDFDVHHMRLGVFNDWDDFIANMDNITFDGESVLEYIKDQVNRYYHSRAKIESIKELDIDLKQ